MIVDAAELPAGHALTCDVCVVGAGAAGIALARELARRGVDVLVLESGGTKYDPAAHDLDKGRVVDPEGHGPIEDYRRRRLGGSTTAWGGRCVPFDPIDFEPRDFVPHSGWPFGLAELEPYYRRAQALCELGEYEYGATACLPEAAARAPMIPGLASSELTTEPVYRFSPPTNFGARYHDELAKSANARVVLHATCVEVATNAEGRLVERLVAKGPGGRRIEVLARRVVLAGGGLEVARLLLSSTGASARGVANDRDLVGRFYMCHVTHHVDVELTRDLVWDYEKTRDGVYCQRTLSVTEAGQRSRRILNHRARVEHPDIADPDHASGVLSATYLAKTFLMRQAANRFLSDKVNVLSKGVVKSVELARPLEHARNVARDLPNVLRFSKRWLTDRVLAERKLPSMVIPSATHRYTLRIDAEQAPDPESRVTLGDEKDALGVPRLVVDWRARPIDSESLERTCALFADAVRSSGIGAAAWAPAAKLQATGGHHVGTTRMSDDPARGVVDASCRVHGVENLFVASSSVFPTCSYANPTLTIVALALRLADRLAGV
ncbi:MAG TPA: GMC family oxidoreductase [Byssovorax sp.]